MSTDVNADLVNRYIEMWNETDAASRRALIARTWTEDATYVDPMLKGDGPAGIDAMVAGVQATYPGLRFRLTSAVDAHNDRLRFTWELGAEGAAPMVKGTDYGVVAGGRLRAITGFFDQVAQAA